MATCEAHKFHRPAPTSYELHHVIPQAWQNLMGAKLFDKRTVVLCPTGHSNVHYWLVLMMRQQARSGNDLLAIRQLLKGESHSRKEAAIAYLAMTRWIDTGVNLSFLWDRGQWGRH